MYSYDKMLNLEVECKCCVCYSVRKWQKYKDEFIKKRLNIKFVTQMVIIYHYNHRFRQDITGIIKIIINIKHVCLIACSSK